MNGNRELEKEENELIFKYYTVLVFFLGKSISICWLHKIE